jgi:hypothetical protein
VEQEGAMADAVIYIYIYIYICSLNSCSGELSGASLE